MSSIMSLVISVFCRPHIYIIQQKPLFYASVISAVLFHLIVYLAFIVTTVKKYTKSVIDLTLFYLRYLGVQRVLL